MEDSIFTKIINGDIPSHKVYEDDKTFAFMDIHPIQPGQILVVLKRQVRFLWELDDDDYQGVMTTVKKLAKRIGTVFSDKSHVGMHVEGLDVAHAHVKVFPFSTDDEFRHHPDMQVEPDHALLAELAKKIQL